jgi:hypothetical protein
MHCIRQAAAAAHLRKGFTLNHPAAICAQVTAVAKLAAVVVATFAACWAPYLSSPAAALEVLQVAFVLARP